MTYSQAVHQLYAFCVQTERLYMHIELKYPLPAGTKEDYVKNNTLWKHDYTKFSDRYG